MRHIPRHLYSAFVKEIRQSGVMDKELSDYAKWLRFYLDFCAEYKHPPRDPDTLQFFLHKLAQKQQSPRQQQQAAHSIDFFYALLKKHPELTQDQSRVSVEWDTCLKQLKNEIAVRQYSRKTYKSYAGWIARFERFLDEKPPADITSEDARKFLTHLAVDCKVSVSTQNQAFNALLFLYRHILKTDYDLNDKIVRAKRTKYIPVVLSKHEVNQIIKYMPYPYDLVVQLLYGCGLRFFECQNLRVHCFNLEEKLLTVHDGKGKKDRTVPLPETILHAVQQHIGKLGNLYEKDMAAGFDGTFMPGALDKKWKNAAKEFSWQWFFPAKTLTLIPEEGEYRRYHMHNTEFQRRLRAAVRKAKTIKRVTAHIFRHSFASHLLQANYAIRTIQEMLGHSDVRTTMIYTHTVKSRTKKDRKSPLDFEAGELRS